MVGLTEHNSIQRTADAERPTVWGLTVPELHDAYWAARGVQVVRRGNVQRLQRAAELFMLIEPGQLVLFDLRSFAERLLWRNARVTRLRVVDEEVDAYREQLDLDDHGNVRSIIRRYGPSVRGSYRVILTRSRRIASMWMQASSARAGWERIRRSMPWSSIDHWRCPGRCFREGDQAEEQECLRHIAEHWPHPDQAIDGIRSTEESVWSLTGSRPPRATVLMGPVWAGNGALTDPDELVVGPTWAPDREPCADNAAALVRPIHLVELADSVRAGGLRPARGWANSLAKRGIDVAVSITALILLMPLIPLIMLAIILEDGRPVYFGHQRQTRGGGVFTCWKFRTMVHNADAMVNELQSRNQADGPQFFISDDPRVTRVGKVLRTLHLDELPQLWNVLRGDMSLVGPRPSPDEENQ